MKRVLITAGYSNLGFAIAEKFHKEGYEVIVTTRDSSRADDRFKTICLDLRRIEDVREKLSAVKELDVLVNNAGIFTEGKAEDLSEESFDSVFSLNIRALYFVIQTLLPALRKKNGSVVNVSSMNAIHPGFGTTAHYDASKGAVSALTRSLSAETGLRINAIAPGLISHPRLEGSSLEEYWKNHTVKKAMLSAAELADTVFFLAESNGIYGVTLPVDNGYMLC